YDFWFYDPNGGYSFIRERRHNDPDGFGSIGSPRTCHMQVNHWAAANHIPNLVPLNMRVRSVVNGEARSWGPACRFERNDQLATCPPTKLMDVPGNPFISCNVFRAFTTQSSQRLFARPIAGATQYEFRFSIPGEGVVVTRSTNLYYIPLGWTNATPLMNNITYTVDVRAMKGGVWCAWGETCTVTICNSGQCGGVSGGGQQNVALDVSDLGLMMWPNPNHGDQVHISLTGDLEDMNTVNIDLFDLSGKRVVAKVIPTLNGTFDTVLDLNGALAGGMYIVHITAGGKTFTERLVVQP
ncbi:MAG: T9SS type A sorting domain-containing protein, partial [Flavobacteriales bacterium]|nr:T9SS type A sorting domain-containing protein [Flavobacteriales bacterium]